MAQKTTAHPLFRPDTAALRFLPEGPYPLGNGRFSWVAIQHGPEATSGSLNIFDIDSGENANVPLAGRPGFAFPCSRDGEFVIGMEHELGILDTNSGKWTTLADGVDAAVEGTIVNDGLIYDGNVIFGCKDLQFQDKKAGLYLWRRSDRRLIQLRDDQVCSNGKAVRKLDGGLQLVDIDSPTRQIVGYRLDIEAGKLGDREVLVDLTGETGVPDGAILTPDGSGVIVSLYNPEHAEAGETRLYELRSGSLQHTWLTPDSPQNTCPQLIELEGAIKLIITTAVEHMPADRQKVSTQAGTLFIADTDFASLSDAPRFESL